MCHSQSSWSHLQISISKNQAHCWRRYSTPWLASYSFQINFSSAPFNCRGFLCLPTQTTLLLLTDLIWKHEFSIFSLPLDASPFCYLTLQLYYLTLSSILTHSLHKAANHFKPHLIAGDSSWIKDLWLCFVYCTFLVTSVDKRHARFNTTRC